MERLTYIDITKGILILLVIAGHIELAPEYKYIHTILLWFHMPAFFILSGMFIKVPKINPLTDKSFWSKNINRYVIPYFSWCAVGFVCFPFESVGKNIIRVLYGGGINTSVYSYPFWFINTLFLGVICISAILFYYGRMKSKKCMLAVISSILFLIGHLLNKKIVDLPWGMGQLTISLAFISTGVILSKKIANYKFDVYFYISLVMSSSLFVFATFNKVQSFNIKAMLLPNVLLDYLIPLCITYSILGFGKLIEKNRIIAIFLKYVGKRSITIFFLHAAILAVLNKICFLQKYDMNPVFLLVLTASISVFIYDFLNTNKYSRKLFIGK